MTRQNLIIRQGETWSFPYTWKDGSGAPIDITGYSARMAVKKSADNATDIFLSTGGDANGGTISLGGALGTILLAMTAEQTDAMQNSDWWMDDPLPLDPSMNFFYDLEVVSPAGQVTRLLEGQVTYYRSITGPN